MNLAGHLIAFRTKAELIAHLRHGHDWPPGRAVPVADRWTRADLDATHADLHQNEAT